MVLSSSTMYPPRKKCRKLFIWFCLAVVAQVMFTFLLGGEFNLAPIRRSKTAERTQRLMTRLRLQSEEFVQPDEKDVLMLRGIQNSFDLKESVEVKQSIRHQSVFLKLRTRTEKQLRVLRPNRSTNMSTSLSRLGDVKPRKGVISDQFVTKNITDSFKFRKGSHVAVNTTNLEDIFISVKTTGVFHETRVTIVLDTWFQDAKDQVYFFTDTEDPKINGSLDGHLIKTPCEVGHQRNKLCCKTQSELDFFSVHNLGTKWFCHFDDDNYVNVPTLVKSLQAIDPGRDVYLGKPSLARAMEAWDSFDEDKKKLFWFATGGAGFCLSRALVNKMSPYISDGRFIQSCNRIRLPDDCTIGFIIESLLNVSLTRSDLFHSHLENLPSLRQQDFNKQISFSHGYMGGMYNRVNINGPFDLAEDPSRFKSIHCFLHPETSWCPGANKVDNTTGSQQQDSPHAR